MEKILQVYRVAAEPSPDCPSDDPLECAFRLMPGPEADEYFYECAMPGCLGSGGSVFKIQTGLIPEEVMDEMRFHANFCRGLFPSTGKL